MTYVRYILVYKLWKKVVKGAEERRRINKQASANITPPDDFRKIARCTMLDGILPNIPKSRTDITQFFMQAKFSVKDKSGVCMLLIMFLLNNVYFYFTNLFLFFNGKTDNNVYCHI